MTDIKESGKKRVDESENIVLETEGGEMPDADRKPGESASEAAKVFENRNKNKNKKDELQSKEVDPKTEKKVA